MIKKFSDFRTEAKDPGEYDREGGMAKTQLRGVLADAEHMIDQIFKILLRLS